MSTEKTAKPNKLATEKSPYLLQHAHNPVDWYPWCDEAFAKAAKEDKPIFLIHRLFHLSLVSRYGGGVF